jgi:hypothetical protein
MGPSINIDIGGAYSHISHQIREWLGHDPESEAWSTRNRL